MSEPAEQAVQPLAFEYHAMPVRTIADPDGSALFVAADVSSILGYTNTGALNRSLDDDEKGVRIMHTPGGAQQFAVITEAGLYQAVLQSRRPEARPFKKWVTGEVLPQIRKTGGYAPDLAQASRSTLLSYLHQATTAGLEAEKEAERLALQNQRMRPYADLGEAVAGSADSRSVGEAAKALGLGPNKLFRWLRELGVLIPQGQHRNLPYQHHIDAGRFEVREVPYTAGEERRSRRKTLVTGRGVGYVRERLARAGLIETREVTNQ